MWSSTRFASIAGSSEIFFSTAAGAAPDGAVSSLPDPHAAMAHAPKTMMTKRPNGFMLFSP
jgi:hypothetical protein